MSMRELFKFDAVGTRRRFRGNPPQFLNRFRHLAPVVTMLLSFGMLSACATNILVEGTLPTPLVEKMPVRVGIYYPEEFRHFKHQEKIDQQGSYKVDFGAQNLGFFKNLMTAVFETPVELQSLPPEGKALEGLDGLLVPEIVKYGFLTPEISGLKFYSASIHYRLKLYDANYQKVTDWMVVGYGKSEAATFGGNKALSESTALAIRDGGARIAIEFRAQPEVEKWLAAMKQAKSAENPLANVGEAP